MQLTKKKKQYLQFIFEIVLLLAAGGLLIAARKVPGFAEWYSSTIYPILVTVIGGAAGLVPISVVEFLLYGGIVLLAVLLIKCRRSLVRLFLNCGMIFSVLLFLYASCCILKRNCTHFLRNIRTRRKRRIRFLTEGKGRSLFGNPCCCYCCFTRCFTMKTVV